MINIYLDDVRPTPGEFHIRAYNVEECIEHIKKYDGEIYKLSLDNDLGVGYREGKEVLNWLEEQAFNNTIKPIPHIIIHTSNPDAENYMMSARYNCWKYWMKHGYNRSDYI